MTREHEVEMSMEYNLYRRQWCNQKFCKAPTKKNIQSFEEKEVLISTKYSQYYRRALKSRGLLI